MKTCTILVLLFLVSNLWAEEQQLPYKSIFTEVPKTSMDTLSTSFSRDSLPYWGIILGSTGVLYHYDEKLYAGAQKKGRQWGIGNEDNTKPLISFGGQDILRLPSDTGSFLYFLGDGWMHAGIATGFIGTGNLTKSSYEVNTGIMLMHGMVVSTIFNQTLKRSFGRESPEVKTHERGAWRPFPSFSNYNNKTANYDAMPSGHIMTATLTWTIITERYPQYSHILYPVAGLWITALGFEMMNNGVHWASDYPLGIAMGYVVAKMSLKMGQSQQEKDPQKAETSWMFIPTVSGDVRMLTASRAF